MPKLIDVDQVGKVYGRLTVVAYIGSGKWLCSCRCGKTKSVPNYYFKQIAYPTCGKCNIGTSYPLAYKSYDSMIQRCHNVDSPDYSRYGGKGITVCARWRKDFLNFLEDIGDRPSKHLTLDRIDNSLGYYKENCRWATAQTQSENSSWPIKSKL
jgi:hypothetical protein